VAIVKASERDIAKLHEASLAILSRIGVVVRHEEVRADLEGIGCKVEEILASHEVAPLEEKLQKEIDEVIEHAQRGLRTG